MGFNQAHIRWYAVAGAQDNDVPWNQVARRDSLMFAVTLDAGIAGEHVADPLQGLFGVALLDMADQGVNHRHAEDHQGIDPVPHDGGQRRGGQQHVNQYVVKVGKKAQPGRFPFLFRQRVRPTAIQALGGVCGT